jgi:hypothetical protein
VQVSRGSIVRILVVLALVACLVAPSAAYATGYDRRATIMATAIEQLGKPYLWAAAGPNAFDCSGLVQYCYKAAGIDVPHQSGMIWSLCDHVRADQLEPGDLVFRTNLASASVVPTQPTNIAHIGIYMGGGQVIHAPGSNKKLCYTSVANFHVYGRLRTGYWPLLDRSYDQPLALRGDFNGDRHDDLAYVQGSGKTLRVYVVLSNGLTCGPSAVWYTNTAWDWKRTKSVAADFNADGKTDIAMLYDCGNATSKLVVLLSNGKGFTMRTWWTSAAGRWSWQRTKLVAGDFNADSRRDVGLFYDNGGSCTMYVARSTGSAFRAPAAWWSGSGWDSRVTKLAVGDLNADGKADVVLLRGYGSSTTRLWVLKSSGSSFTMLATPWYDAKWDWNRTKMCVADFNGDRRADVMMLYDYGAATSKLWEFRSTGSGLVRSLFWASAPGTCDWERVRFGAGDVDRDGRADVISTYGAWSAAVTPSTRAWKLDVAAGGVFGGRSSLWGGSLDWNRIE